MSYPSAAVRTVVAELLEGTIGSGRTVPAGTFARGVFDGQAVQAQRAKSLQTSTARHWFDVECGALRNHPSTPISNLGSLRICTLDIVIRVTSKASTQAQGDQRATDLALIMSDCEQAAMALATPNNLLATAAAVDTGIISGFLRGPDGLGIPTVEKSAQVWDRNANTVTTLITAQAILQLDTSGLSVDAGPSAAWVANALQLAGVGATGGTAPYEYQWTKLSGPGGVSFDDATALDAIATRSAPGTYTLLLTVTDATGGTATDEVSLAADTPEEIFAGADQVLWLEYDPADVTTHFTTRYLMDEVRNRFSGGGALDEPASDSTRMTWHADGGPGDRPYIDGSAGDRVGDTGTTWVAANTSWRAYAVLRVDSWAFDGRSLEIGPMRLRENALVWGWQHIGGGGEEAISAVSVASAYGATTAWVAIRMRYLDDVSIGLGVNNETIVSEAIAAAALAVDKIHLSATPAGGGATDSQAMLVIVRGAPNAAEDSAMANYINERFGTADLPALTW